MTPIKPNFLYIGASKAGSSWLDQVLREHPDVFIPDAKDIMFFDRYYDKGVDWYLGFFEDAGGRTAVGEISHDYFLFPECAPRIHQLLPDVKLVACLREPVKKTISAYLYNLTTNFDKDTKFADYAFLPQILKLSDYYHNLEPFYRLFPKENILVLFFDELQDDPKDFLQRVYAHLGVDAAYEPPSVNKIILAAREPRAYFVAHLVYRAGGMFRALGMANLVGRVKRSPFFNKLLYKKPTHPPEAPVEVQRQLHEHFRADYEKLEALIGRKLPPSWWEKP